MCLYPKLIENRKYVANKKNGGNIPPLPVYKGKVDERVKLVPVKCGKCMECMKQRSREWQVRLSEEIKDWEVIKRDGKLIQRMWFVTLTFSDESIKELGDVIGDKLDGFDKENAIAKLGLRRFLERWRKKHKKSVRHWFVTELGKQGTENIHLHGIMFTELKEDIEPIWNYGYVYCGEYVNEKTINYIVKYIYKTDGIHKYYKPKILTSAGIGRNYKERKDVRHNQFRGKETNELYTNRKGYKMALPIYYRNQIYTEDEREILWLQKLDKEVRYVNGIKVDISKNEDAYYELLENARIKNEWLGFQNDTINWDERYYERQRANLNHKKRVARAIAKANDRKGVS